MNYFVASKLLYFGAGHTKGSYMYLEQKHHSSRSVEREDSTCSAKTNSVQQDTGARLKAK